MTKYPRGSEWRKWDLHLHTPGTAKNDQYSFEGDIWEKYVTTLEEQTDVFAFGITDYWSVDNWHKLVDEYQKRGRLVGRLLIPNAELRITPVTGTATPINIHVLFDPGLPYEDIQRQFFKQLFFERCNQSFDASRDGLVALGRCIMNNPNLEESAAWRRGVEQFQVSYTDLKEIVRNDYWKKHCLVCVDNGKSDGASGIQDSAMRESRCEIYRMSDIIFSSNAKDIQYFLGRDCDPKDEVIRQYGSVKPCVHGSDSHDFTKLDQWHKGKVTWVKSDPTFDGLRQILFEPEERVRIQSEIPNQKSSYHLLDSVTLQEYGFWKESIPLNKGLVAIIGGRSSGKSSLLASIAKKINGKIQLIEGTAQGKYIDYIDQHLTSLTFKWADGLNDSNRQVEYFSQNYMIDLVSEQDQLNDIILNILKSRLQKDKVWERYEQDVSALKALIVADAATLFAQRTSLATLDVAIREGGGKEGHEQEISKLGKAMAVLRKSHMQMTDQEIAEFDDIKSEIDGLLRQIEECETDSQALIGLKDQVLERFRPTIEVGKFSDGVAKDLSAKVAEIWDAANKAWLEYLGEMKLGVETRMAELKADVQTLQNKDVYIRGLKNIESNSNLTELESRINEEKKKRSSIEALLLKSSSIEEENDRIIKQLAQNHIAFYDKASSYAEKMTLADGELQIEGWIETREMELRELLEGKMRRVSQEQKAYVEKMIAHADYKVEDATDYLKATMQGTIQYNQDVNEQFVVSEFLSTSWFKAGYKVTYQGDSLDEMSPGKRAFVILKLLLEFSNKECPILIDQPEDSLDNRAIYTELVQYLRDKKKKRQIILVTHNPNVVVGADAEQVIVANQNGIRSQNEGDVKFAYVSGSLEDSEPKNRLCNTVLEAQGIREHVCEILEGGEDAFRHRESKYGL